MIKFYKKYYVLIIIFCLLIFLGTKVVAADYYVSQEGAGLKDGSSEANAWAGWSAINWPLVQAGDTVYVMGTIFGGTGFGIADSVNGAEGSPITVKGHPTYPGIMYEGKVYDDTNWSPEVYGAYSRSVRRCNYNYIREWTEDPLVFTALIKESDYPNASWLPGSFYCDVENRILYYRPSDDVLSGKSITVKWNTIPTMYISGDYITIENLAILHGIRAGGGNPAQNLTINNCIIKGDHTIIGIAINPGGNTLGSHNGTITNCEISGATNGIYLINQGYDEINTNHNWIINHNKIFDISGTKDSHAIGIQGGDNHLFEHNKIYDCGSGITFWVQPSKIYFNNGSVEPIVGETVCSSSGGSAVVAYIGTSVSSGTWAGGDATGYIRVNSITGPWNSGDIITGSEGALSVATGDITQQTQNDVVVRNNYIYNMNTNDGGNGRGIEYSGDHSENHLVSSGLVYNNIITDTENSALRIKATFPAGWKFFNNTINDSYYGFYCINSNYVANKNPDFILKNNVFLNYRNSGYHVFMAQTNVDPSNTSLEKNVYWSENTMSENFWRWNGSSVNDFDTWLSLSNEENSIMQNPKLSNFSGNFSESSDYSPAWNSYLIDNGNNVEADHDFFGNPIYGIRDIGAIEYQPPYTMGSDPVDIGANIRLYGDSKYRYKDSPNGTTADLSIIPNSSDTSCYMDLIIVNWETTGNYYKKWTEKSPNFSNIEVSHSIGDLKANQSYDIYYTKEGESKQKLTTISTNASGELTFNYINGYPSELIFEIKENTDNSGESDSSYSSGSSLSSSAGSSSTSGSDSSADGYSSNFKGCSNFKIRRNEKPRQKGQIIK